jgi:hypothetical protein
MRERERREIEMREREKSSRPPRLSRLLTPKVIKPSGGTRKAWQNAVEIQEMFNVIKS